MAKKSPRSGRAANATMSSGRRPQVCAFLPTQGENNATRICGPTMHAAISTVAHLLERVVKTLPMRGSIAALARWNSMTQPAKMISGRFPAKLSSSAASLPVRRSGIPPQARSGSISRGEIRRSTSRAGTSNAAVMKNTARADRKYPHAPIAAAASPLPTAAKRALRPSRSPMAACPTRPRLIAAMAGPSTQLAAACSTTAANITTNIGDVA